jgi:hypothetical protein
VQDLDADTVRQKVIDHVERNRQAVTDLNDAIVLLRRAGPPGRRDLGAHVLPAMVQCM